MVIAVVLPSVCEFMTYTSTGRGYKVNSEQEDRFNGYCASIRLCESVSLLNGIGKRKQDVVVYSLSSGSVSSDWSICSISGLQQWPNRK